MDYKEYMKLDFLRTDMCDQVVFNQTGYSGYYLSKEINDRLSVCVYHDELDKPRLYVTGSDKSLFVTINDEMVRMIFAEKIKVHPDGWGIYDSSKPNEFNAA